MSGVVFSFNKISGLSSVVHKVSSGEVEEAARVAETYAKNNVQVLTGETRDSIHTETDGDSVNLLAGGASLFLEYGTVHMRAFPFMRPAMDAAEQAITADHLKTVFEDTAKLGGA